MRWQLPAAWSGDDGENDGERPWRGARRRGTARERRCVYWLGEGKLEEAGAAAAASLADGHGGHSHAQRVQAPESEGERGREWSE